MKYTKFTNEGKREESLIDHLLDKMNSGGLNKNEQDLLNRLIAGETLPEPKKGEIILDKLGGFQFDKDGNVITKKSPGEESPDGEIRTGKGQQKGQQIEQPKLFDSRVYRDFKSDEKFYFSYEKENGWIVYRTKGKNQVYGTFMDMSKNPGLSKLSTAEMWKRNENAYDIYMILDEEYVNYLTNYLKMKDQDDKKSRAAKIDIYNKLNTTI